MKSPIEIFVGQKVKEYREKRNWSLRYLGDCLNVHHSFINRCEAPKEDVAFNLDHINTLARIFECKISDLLPVYPLDDKNSF